MGMKGITGSRARTHARIDGQGRLNVDGSLYFFCQKVERSNNSTHTHHKSVSMRVSDVMGM